MGPQVKEGQASKFFGRLAAHEFVGHFTLPQVCGTFPEFGQYRWVPGFHAMRWGIPAFI